MTLNLNFGKCLWFLIPKNSQVYTLCKELQSVSDFQYSPHITVAYNISNNEPIDKWKKIIQNGISLKLSHPLSFYENNNRGFHVLQLNIDCTDYSDNKVIENYTGFPAHLSFAYRFNKPFTMGEKIKVYKILHKNHFSDLSITPILATQDSDCNHIEQWIGHIV